jgi:NAD-dependent DNA ligase
MPTNTTGKIGHISINIEGKRLFFHVFSSELIDTAKGSPALFKLRKKYKFLRRFPDSQKHDFFTVETLAQEVAKSIVEMLSTEQEQKHISPFAAKGTPVRVDTPNGYALTHIKRAPYEEEGQFWVDLCGVKGRVNIELVHRVEE